MANYLVTGGCGFIGSHLVAALLEQGHQVRVLDDLSSGSAQRISTRAQLRIGCVSDLQVVHSCMQGVDGCYHLAAVSSAHKSGDDWLGSHRVNLTGSINVFKAASVRRTPVVYASSAAVYGDNANVPLAEYAALRPCSAYAADKLGTELHARTASLRHGVPTIGLRLFGVYGPGQNPDSPYTGVLSGFIERLMRGESITVPGDGEQVRDLIHISDAIRFLLAAMGKASLHSQVFNVCSGQTTTLRQVADLLTRIAGSPHPVTFGQPNRGDLAFSVGDTHNARHILGLHAELPIGDGLRQLLASLPSRLQEISQPTLHPVTRRRSPAPNASTYRAFASDPDLPQPVSG